MSGSARGGGSGMGKQELTPAEVLDGMRRGLDAIDALFPPAPIDDDLVREAQSFYEMAVMTLNRRGCAGRPFGARWESMTESARAIWIEAMAQWKGTVEDRAALTGGEGAGGDA